MEFDRIKLWKDPENSGYDETLIHGCRPEFYVGLSRVSDMIVDVMERHAKKSWSILEIGCGTGRNLVALKNAGFYRVRGIEISQRAIDVGIETFPEYAEIEVMTSAVEDIIKDIRPTSVIFTSGMLMHLPFELDWVLEEISKKATKLIVTNEAELERKDSIHVWRRNYKDVFEALGWAQVEATRADVYGLPPWTIKRVFVPGE